MVVIVKDALAIYCEFWIFFGARIDKRTTILQWANSLLFDECEVMSQSFIQITN